LQFHVERDTLADELIPEGILLLPNEASARGGVAVVTQRPTKSGRKRGVTRLCFVLHMTHWVTPVFEFGFGSRVKIFRDFWGRGDNDE